MLENAKSSSLIKSFNIVNIPNPIDTNIFKSNQKQKVREIINLPLNKKLLLFGAANASNKSKGIDYLIEGLKLFEANYAGADEFELILLGKSTTNLKELFNYNVNYLGVVEDEEKMALVYQAADIFILPTLSDNLPNMVIESMACETPVVSFYVGGVPEIIDHKKNGYLAEYKSSADLARGIEWIFENNVDNCLGRAAREKVLKCYSEEVVAGKYIELYQSLISEKKA
jgi:glycosyltransferase involved in cell wall biosynthesis